ncbi:winged helix-turn-helix transcriptional regulator [Aquimarina sp. 2201CG5-10]|uniref:winged helix-turn-helix transcriptional regulator n=1 Tax=Aquimarina callyspongiae TaxID=3098150 RepID=UPI002AB484D5|nr:winged helix-turn-helix transcriptional regulator [Aquimarina sp. 2201CG5-10]MDY8138040.1 winged helix-turn-helix transcriptional regulator [Aquimarina sp. 2201CG5-10]
MEKDEEIVLSRQCIEQILAIKDTMELISGKWKILIIGILLLNGTMRFMKLKKALNGITSKKLSSDLQYLEMNRLITRTVVNSKPITVEYALTSHGRTLDNLIAELIDLGLNHRQEIIKK